MYIPHSDAEREEMLKVIGVNTIEDLFNYLPNEKRFPLLNLPKGVSEMEAFDELNHIASVNESAQDLICFLGAGAYYHYTPYQPEISQGTLQAIFEYQSLISALTGMDVSNASHYDGATAVAEAINMAYHHFRMKRPKVVMSPAVNPHYKETVRTYIQGSGIQLVGDHIPPLSEPDELIPFVDEDTALVVVQYPDFLGRIYDYTKLAESAHSHKALLAIHANPLSLGLLKSPGEFGADIVTGEGQSLGIPMSFGGPYLGIFATRSQYVRKMAGRLVGETVDSRGQRGYVLTLSTREQHIRREKATSNICSNQGLLALAAGIYLSLLGKSGLQKIAKLNFYKSHYAAKAIDTLDHFQLISGTPFFNEFVIKCPYPVAEINQVLLDHDILGGFDLGTVYQDLQNHMLVAVTEMISKEEIDYLVKVLSEVPNA